MNTENSSFDSLIQYNLQPVIYSLSLLQRFDAWLKHEGIPAFPVHLELETGMNRLGLAAEDIDGLLTLLCADGYRVEQLSGATHLPDCNVPADGGALTSGGVRRS